MVLVLQRINCFPETLLKNEAASNNPKCRDLGAPKGSESNAAASLVPRSEVGWDGNVKSGEDQMMWLNKGWLFEPSLAELRPSPCLVWHWRNCRRPLLFRIAQVIGITSTVTGFALDAELPEMGNEFVN